MRKIKNYSDLILIKFPMLYYLQLPSGMGYTHNVLKKCSIKFKTYDLNEKFYNLHLKKTDNFNSETSKNNLKKFLLDFSDKIVEANPKVIGISIDSVESFLKESLDIFLRKIKQKLPHIIFIAGGQSCFSYNYAMDTSKLFDYYVLTESELSLPFLVKEILLDRKVKDAPGIVSRFDSPERMYKNSPLLKDLEQIDFPRYEWTDLKLYQDKFIKSPAFIVPNRGCPYNRCYFCSELLRFRSRSPKSLADEVEYLNKKGFIRFYFNASDFNGDPEMMIGFCREIIKRRIKVHIGGQMRVDDRNDSAVFRLFEKAGIKYIKFGIDGWSDRALKLLNKGYNMKTVKNNLKNCSSAGIISSVFVLTGMPGETEEDVDEYIKNISELAKYIDQLHLANDFELIRGIYFYNNHEKFNIEFKMPVEEIEKNFTLTVPKELWYCREPYLDTHIAEKRLLRIANEFKKQRIPITSAIELPNEEVLN